MKDWLMIQDDIVLSTMCSQTSPKPTFFKSLKNNEKQIDYILTKGWYLRCNKGVEINDMMHMINEHRSVITTFTIFTSSKSSHYKNIEGKYDMIKHEQVNKQKKHRSWEVWARHKISRNYRINNNVVPEKVAVQKPQQRIRTLQQQPNAKILKRKQKSKVCVQEARWITVWWRQTKHMEDIVDVQDCTQSTKRSRIRVMNRLMLWKMRTQMQNSSWMWRIFRSQHSERGVRLYRGWSSWRTVRTSGRWERLCRLQCQLKHDEEEEDETTAVNETEEILIKKRRGNTKTH